MKQLASSPKGVFSLFTIRRVHTKTEMGTCWDDQPLPSGVRGKRGGSGDLASGVCQQMGLPSSNHIVRRVSRAGLVCLPLRCNLGMTAPTEKPKVLLLGQARPQKLRLIVGCRELLHSGPTLLSEGSSSKLAESSIQPVSKPRLASSLTCPPFIGLASCPFWGPAPIRAIKLMGTPSPPCSDWGVAGSWGLQCRVAVCPTRI